MVFDILQGCCGKNCYVVMLIDGLLIIGDVCVKGECCLVECFGVSVYIVFLGEGECFFIFDVILKEIGGFRFFVCIVWVGIFMVEECI